MRIHRIRRGILKTLFEYTSYSSLNDVANSPILLKEEISPDELNDQWKALIDNGYIEPLGGYNNQVGRLSNAERATIERTGNCSATGMPIGGVIAAKNAVIPSAVGVDIGCGMIAVETDINADFFDDMSLRRELLGKLKERIPVGEGKSHENAQEWENFEHNQFVNKLDRHNLGTLGGGNHFIELQKSDQNKVWLMIHSGSRNLGYRIENHYFKIATEMNKNMGVTLPNSYLPFLPMDTQEGQEYFRDMNFALEYALENRRRMMEQFKGVIQEYIPTIKFIQEINIHHNYASLEEHFGAKYYIHRKGATSARVGELGIIPGSMGTNSYIVKGLGNADSFCSCSHGAGRKMSRTTANNTLNSTDCDNAMNGICHDRWGISRRHGKKVLDLSEAPLAYKDIDEVIASELDLITPIVKLSPLAVLKG